MKTFKLVDALISTTLMIVAISIAFTRHNGYIFYCYLIVGGWQLASMVIHETNR